MIGTVFGGIGLFLLGMILMTEGLKAAAGDALRAALARMTGGAGRAMLSGLAATALVQSSSATVLTTIGFVSAGLLTFTQAVGVVFGANLGTTSTGWMVSLIGLKVNVAALALPLVGVGALMRLMLRGRASSAGLALAGFGVIFVGIDLLQGGMSELATRLDPGRFPGSSMGGRILLVAVGALMTVVMQSSSAAVATTLTALHAGPLSLEQAVPLVIGQNLGTTVTAALAAIGASVPARRTALAHILFNVVAAVAAFGLAPLFLHVAALLDARDGTPDPAVSLAAFHTSFNLVGVLLLLPVAPRFAALVSRMIPEREPSLTRNLDPSVAELPAVAVEAARRTVMGIARTLVAEVERATGVIRAPADPGALDRADRALDEVRAFLRRVRMPSEMSSAQERNLATLHAVDHLEQLVGALREPPLRRLLAEPIAALSPAALEQALAQGDDWLAGGERSAAEGMRVLSTRMAEVRREGRLAALAAAARGELDPDEALARIEAMRWLDAVLYHVWRSTHHLETISGRGSATDDDMTRGAGAAPPE